MNDWFCWNDTTEAFPGQLARYRADAGRAMRSTAGQARLRELRDALKTLPVKALGVMLVDPCDGTVGALGAWVVAACDGDLRAAAAMVPFDAPPLVAGWALASRGWPPLVVHDVSDENEAEIFKDHNDDPAVPAGETRRETDEERYVRMLAWVESHIVKES